MVDETAFETVEVPDSHILENEADVDSSNLTESSMQDGGSSALGN